MTNTAIETDALGDIGGMPQIVVRQASASEIDSFVTPNWISALARSLLGKWARADARYGAGRERYWSRQTKRIHETLASQGVSVLVAVVDDVLAGFAVENRTAREVHYVFTVVPFRKQGVARALVGWIDDSAGGLVALRALPPPWFSKPQEGAKEYWRPHQVIDLF
jgi:hypothetical protein